MTSLGSLRYRMSISSRRTVRSEISSEDWRRRRNYPGWSTGAGFRSSRTYMRSLPYSKGRRRNGIGEKAGETSSRWRLPVQQTAPAVRLRRPLSASVRTPVLIKSSVRAMSTTTISTVHCRRCGATFHLASLSDRDRSRVAEMSRAGHGVQAMQLLRQISGVEIGDAKATEMHITRTAGVCHRCHRALPDPHPGDCPKCGALNYDW